jgi:uncharacterized lipoprotein YddW (UPF0748 family)
VDECTRSSLQEFLLSLVLEVVKNYEVDGIQGDDRLPALPCEGAMMRELLNATAGHSIVPPQNFKDQQWLQWRADILTDFLARLYQEIKAINPDLGVDGA